MAKPFTFTVDQEGEIRRLHDEGFGYTRIAQQFGCSPSTIARLFKPLNPAKKNKNRQANLSPSLPRLLTLDELTEGQREQYENMCRSSEKAAFNYLIALSKYHYGVNDHDKRKRPAKPNCC
jgi:hypothetical protein